MAAWLVYVGLSSTQLLYRPALFLLIGGVLVALAAYLLGQVYSGRGTFMHIGAMLGTIMAANVFFVIIPSQKKLVRAAQLGETLDPYFVACAVSLAPQKLPHPAGALHHDCPPLPHDL